MSVLDRHNKAVEILYSGAGSKPRRRTIVPNIIAQHVDDAISLHEARTALTRAAHVTLSHLGRFDNRLAANLDGLFVAGNHAAAFCDAALEHVSASGVFVAAVCAIQEQNLDWLERLFALVEAVPEAQPGLLSALGWLEPNSLQGIVEWLLTSHETFKRTAGISACAMHRVDPEVMLVEWIHDENYAVRARALRGAGELGRSELVSTLALSARDAEPACGFWAAWSAVLLGDRQRALELLKTIGLSEGPFQARAFQLALQALPLTEAHALLGGLSTDPGSIRRLIQGVGLVGDPIHVPWLISLMVDDASARLAGEAFSMITGIDIALIDLERDPPDEIDGGPNDDPGDSNVALDLDDDLPWPDQQLVQSWWRQNAARFPTGIAHVLGSPLSRALCIHVLRDGYQRQRLAASIHRSLLSPGTPLFECRAPSWRQQLTLKQTLMDELPERT